MVTYAKVTVTYVKATYIKVTYVKATYVKVTYVKVTYAWGKRTLVCFIWLNLKDNSTQHWVSGCCCLAPNEKFYSYIMAWTSYILIR